MSDQFRTYQTVRRYEEALARHGQWLRWTQATACPCVSGDTMQPDPRCTLCTGRGRIYRTPEGFDILGETAVSVDGSIKPKFRPATPISVMHKTTTLPLGTQPTDRSRIQLADPFPPRHRVLTLNYRYTPEVSVAAENSEVYNAERFILRTSASRFSEKGKTFEGTVKTVSRVYNVTKKESYGVGSISKEFITLRTLGKWAKGDVLAVDYTYVKPFDFLLTGVSGRIRYEQPYVLESADAILVTPYWAQPSPDDLFTALAQERTASVIIDPAISDGNDRITAYFDLSRILHVIDRDGATYTGGLGKDVEIFGRDELKWNRTKPRVPYTVQFTYHPTYTALTDLHTLRNSENKAFVNRVSVKLFDRLHEKVPY